VYDGWLTRDRLVFDTGIKLCDGMEFLTWVSARCLPFLFLGMRHVPPPPLSFFYGTLYLRSLSWCTKYVPLFHSTLCLPPLFNGTRYLLSFSPNVVSYIYFSWYAVSVLFQGMRYLPCHCHGTRYVISLFLFCIKVRTILLLFSLNWNCKGLINVWSLYDDVYSGKDQHDMDVRDVSF
jgi:hypothetical protein